jgi:group I intron endonuclease
MNLNEKDIGIYLIKNLKTKKIYIGQSYNISKRIKQHWYKGSLLYKSIKKYGKECFIWGVIEYCLPEELNSKEAYWIDYYKSYEHTKGYNILKGPNENPVPKGSKRGIEFCEKLKIIASQKNYKGDKNPFYGKKHSKETIIKLKEINSKRIGELNNFYGKKHTEKSKEKMSINRKGKEVNYGLKKVCKFSKDRNIFLNQYNSLRDACKDMGKSPKESTRITACCKGRTKSAFGYYWRYLEDDFCKNFKQIKIEY